MWYLSIMNNTTNIFVGTIKLEGDETKITELKQRFFCNKQCIVYCNVETLRVIITR